MKSDFAVELRLLNKTFGNLRAVQDVSLKVERGTIHGIIGENGAGKSTTMKMLYGLYKPDSGDIYINGEKRVWSSPKEAIAAGLGMVHQHFMLAGPYTALDNIILGNEPSSLPWLPSLFQPIKRYFASKSIESIAKAYGFKIKLTALVETLPVGVQQRIEILKLLYTDANILILDEPTAVLTPHETEEFFDNLRRLREEGKTVIIITHKLREVMALTDNITVLRHGKVVGETKTSETTPEKLAEMMVGRRVQLKSSSVSKSETGEIALRLENISLKPKHDGKHFLSSLSFVVRAGEILGIAGAQQRNRSSWKTNYFFDFFS